jgi:diaminohydroxyphosphoribosylaminopyrimidine deaminase/5-amino-6-(5-phosphoribosylamino)uracil reductase
MRALELAGRARGQTSPNPIVGAWIVKDGRVIGEGITQAAGEGHAEVMAIEAAAGHTAGATMYVSLEPCCHQGPHAAMYGGDRGRRHQRAS